ncbi:MAG: glycosyltransferase family 39 protein [Chloroflexi bacterium]|nr:glycosyltransferase family 39 protein [Chloroflexota bacterium]
MRLITDLRRGLPRLGLPAVLLLAAWLRFSRLGQSDNQYYTAAVASMLQSWHNFFFVSFDPGGVVTVDKPPFGLWLDALPAALLGVSGWSVSLVHAVAGLGSVGLLYMLVRPVYGRAAALLATLAVAVMPAAVAMDSRNEPDSVVAFLLVLTAFCVVRATGARSPSWLLLAGAVAAGIGFNTKMWVALVPMPVFLAYYLLAGPRTWRLRLAHVAAALAVLAVVSLSWVWVVAATPPERRPYIGSTRDNSIWTLVVEYNGLQRLGGFIGPRKPAPVPSTGQLPGPPPGPGIPPAGPVTPGPTPAKPDLAEMFTSPLADQLGGLLLLAWFAGAMASLRWMPRGVFRHPQRWLGLVRSPAAGQSLLWVGWLACAFMVYGLAASTRTHPYYLSQLVVPMAAVLAIGLTAAWQRYRHLARLSWALPLATAIGGAFQIYYLRETAPVWAVNASAILLIGAVGVLVLALWHRATNAPLARASVAAACLSLLVIPLALSRGALGPLVGARPPPVQGVAPAPSAGSPAPGAPLPGPGGPRWVEAVASFVSAQGDAGNVFAVGAVRVSEAAPFIVRGIPAVAIGGFSGSDPIFTPDSLEAMARQGKLRYFVMATSTAPALGRPQGPGPQGPILERIRRTWQDVSLQAGLPPGTLYRQRGP